MIHEVSIVTELLLHQYKYTDQHIKSAPSLPAAVFVSHQVFT